MDEKCIYYLRIQDYDRAVERADSILNDDPFDPGALLTKGLAYEMKDELPLALSFYSAITEICPEDSDALKHKAIVEMELHLDSQAYSDIDKSIQLYKLDSESFLIRGMILFYAFNKKLDAILDYNQALYLDPQNAQALFHRGYAYLKCDDRKNARNDFSKAAKLGYDEAKNMLDQYFPESKREQKW